MKMSDQKEKKKKKLFTQITEKNIFRFSFALVNIIISMGYACFACEITEL